MGHPYHNHNVLHGYVVMIAKSGAAYQLTWQIALGKQTADGLARTTMTRHLVIVRYHKRRQMLRLMLSWIFLMLLLMKLTTMDQTQKLLKHHPGHMSGQTHICIVTAGINPSMRAWYATASLLKMAEWAVGMAV
jgi:hypothetical protein